jgi:hypothetical protein
VLLDRGAVNSLSSYVIKVLIKGIVKFVCDVILLLEGVLTTDVLLFYTGILGNR